MAGTALPPRERIDVAGADRVVASLRERVRSGLPAGIAAARALAARDVDWRPARDRIRNSARSVVLAGDPAGGGPVLAARYFDPTEATPIHDHGVAGAALVVEGRERYERFERTGATTARLESIHELAAGDLMWWNDPPDDLHRQRGAEGDGAIELILVAGAPNGSTTFSDETPDASPLESALLAGFLAGDMARLAPWYADDVLVDANVPHWRFQARGREAALGLLDSQEFSRPDRRLSFVRTTATGAHLLLETELRFTEAGELRVNREAHHLRVRDGLVVEHVVWCTGVVDFATARHQFATAPMERA